MPRCAGGAAGITDPLARQRLIVELYDKFFRDAFPRTTQMLGIVYTPVEIVDFIIGSVNKALEEEFGQTLGSKGVHNSRPLRRHGHLHHPAAAIGPHRA